ncbi:MAG: hypothetical protein ACFFD4_31145 [Candidatus Odinarchaeota archaeon]
MTFNLLVEGYGFPVGFYPLTEDLLQWVPKIVAEESAWLQERELCDRIILDSVLNGFDTYNLIEDHSGKFLMTLKHNSELKEAVKKREPYINGIKHKEDLC